MISLAVKLLFILFLITAASGSAIGKSEKLSPQLTISLIDVNLESGRSGTILLDLKNNESDKESYNKSYNICEGDALTIMAELQNKDDSIKVLSGPQVAGALSPGSNRSLEFSAEVNTDASPGLYPMELILTYRRLTGIETSGDPVLPDVSFHYQNQTQRLPIDVRVLQGPRVAVKDVRGTAYTGSSSEIELMLSNHGDVPALDLHVAPIAQPPFNVTSDITTLDRLDPGSDASIKIKASVENSTSSGDYAIPLRISYRDGKNLRIEEAAALVQVKEKTGAEPIIVIPAVFLAIIILSIIYFYSRKTYGTYGKKRRRLRL